MVINLNKFDVLVVGGGLFGVSTALKLAKDRKVLLIERNPDILLEASFVNQNRVHFGFHYPRSLETAFESLDGYDLFKERFGRFMRNFESYYGIVAEGSLTSPEDFLKFSETLKQKRNVQYKPVDANHSLFKPGSVSCLMETYEPVIDMAMVRDFLKQEVKANRNLTVYVNTTALSLDNENPFIVSTNRGKFVADYLVNASFGNLAWHAHPAAPKIELQMVEMVELESDKFIPGFTLMDGPGCFGILPIGFSEKRYWWYSVAYSVHGRIEVKADTKFRPPFYNNWERMREQGKSVFNFMDDLKYVKSHFTPRTLVVDPRVDLTAARPSVVTTLVPGFYQVLSGKLTTCMRVAEEVERRIITGNDDVSMPIGDTTHIRRAA